MVTYAVNQTWSGPGYRLSLRLQSIGLDQRAQLPNPASDDVVTRGPRSPYRTRCLRQRVIGTDPLVLPDNILHERFRFLSEGIHHLIVLVGHYVDNA